MRTPDDFNATRKIDQGHMFKVLANNAGLDDDSHGKDTPERFVRMLREMTSCAVDLTTDDHLRDCIKWKVFPRNTDEMIILQGIQFVSLCNHHVVPFAGSVHIGYVPRDVEAGLSKFARVVGHFSKRLQVQERMTGQIADFLEEALESPRGVAVVVEAEHLCMAYRGVKASGVVTVTSAMRGVFADHERTAKAEFLNFVNGNGGRH